MSDDKPSLPEFWKDWKDNLPPPQPKKRGRPRKKKLQTQRNRLLASNFDFDKGHIFTQEELMMIISSMIERSRIGDMDARQVSATAQMVNQLIKLHTFREKQDPVKNAKKVLTFQEHMKLASKMSEEDARQIAQASSMAFIEDKMMSIEVEGEDDDGNEQYDEDEQLEELEED